jgi:NADPH-dependent 2,4-dienoyl-CoA reductase/sulfur reductase-like enzyme
MRPHDVIILGGGPAGLAAARRLRELGIRDIVLLEREAVAGGIPRHCGHTGFGLREFGWPLTGPTYARRLAAATKDLDIRTRTTVTHIEPGGRVHVVHPENGASMLVGRRVLLALGVRETPRSTRLVSGTRPWGVTTTGALQQFVYLTGIKPFERAVVVGTELVSFSVLLTLRHGGMQALAMLEEGPRIIARRPGDWIARHLLGVPVLTGTRLVAIHGRTRVEVVEIERAGKHETIACDGVVFTGGFRPETAILRESHLKLDPGTGGPAIDQYWRCSDPQFFAAGNLLRGVETAAVAWAEGRRAAEAIAQDLPRPLPDPASHIPVSVSAPLKYVYPQSLALPANEIDPLLFRLRVSRPARGRLRLLADGREIWSRRVNALPERRLSLPVHRIPRVGIADLAIELAEE